MDKDLWNKIENVIHAKTVKDLSKSLKDCLSELESKNADKRKLINVLNQHLLSIGGAHRIDALFCNRAEKLQNVYIHDYKNAPVIYASHRLIAISKITEYKVRLKEIINFFDNELEKPRTAGLKRDQVYDVLSFLQSRYRIFDIITCKTELEIFLFENSHKEFNSLCEIFYDVNMPQTYYNRYILTFASRSEEHDPYQVLIHEIGHALQVALTHEIRIIPESFIKMNKVLDVHLENNTIETTDVFADIFSVVAMNKSHLAEHNWLISHFPSKILDLFECYFDKLLKHALENRQKLKDKKLDIIWED